jgi:hypothetical protein
MRKLCTPSAPGFGRWKSARDEVVDFPLAEAVVLDVVRMVNLLEKRVHTRSGGWFLETLWHNIGPVTVEHSGGRFLAHRTVVGRQVTWSLVRVGYDAEDASDFGLLLGHCPVSQETVDYESVGTLLTSPLFAF